MPFGYPGVYVEEAPSDVHVIAGVPTSTAAFLGATQFGPVAAPVLVHSFAEFAAHFGGLAAEMPLGYAVQHFFLNGGRDALIARVEPAGATLADADLSDPALEQQRRGLWLLEHAERFNLLCIPPLSRTTDVGRATWDAATAYAARRRAMVIVDPPAAWTVPQTISETAIAALAGRSPNAALYYPRLRAPDPLQGNQIASFAPCGAVAGIHARIDGTRGVWKAPAGTEATIRGIRGVEHAMSDGENGLINPQAVNALRVFPAGVVSWGARTMVGFNNSGNDDYKYVPVRRLALFMEESLYRGLQFAVFEPNDEPLWAQIRLAAGAFMNNLFRQGAFQGQKSSDAYFVKVDSETTTQNDINLGIVNVVIGFAPLKPAEFVIITLQQRAGEVSV